MLIHQLKYLFSILSSFSKKNNFYSHFLVLLLIFNFLSRLAIDEELEQNGSVKDNTSQEKSQKDGILDFLKSSEDSSEISSPSKEDSDKSELSSTSVLVVHLDLRSNSKNEEDDVDDADELIDTIREDIQVHNSTDSTESNNGSSDASLGSLGVKFPMEEDKDDSLNGNTDIFSISTDGRLDMKVVSNSEKNHNQLEVETGEGKAFNTLGAKDLNDLRSLVKDGTTDDTITEDLADSELNTFNIDFSVDEFVEAAFSENKELQGILGSSAGSGGSGGLFNLRGLLSGTSLLSGFGSILSLGSFNLGLFGFLGVLSVDTRSDQKDEDGSNDKAGSHTFCV